MVELNVGVPELGLALIMISVPQAAKALGAGVISTEQVLELVLDAPKLSVTVTEPFLVPVVVYLTVGLAEDEQPELGLIQADPEPKFQEYV